RDGSSPIKEILLDVAERGRSLGIVLIGAQQTASEVERRIIANSSIRVVGRLDSAEASREEYGFLPQVHRQRATIIKPGTMLISQPELPVPVVAEFPFPAWATRPSEVAPGAGGGDVPEDPFEGLDCTVRLACLLAMELAFDRLTADGSCGFEPHVEPSSFTVVPSSRLPVSSRRRLRRGCARFRRQAGDRRADSPLRRRVPPRGSDGEPGRFLPPRSLDLPAGA